MSTTRTTARPQQTSCPHTPTCPGADAPDALAARIVSEHLEDCGYALLCNGAILLEGAGLLPQPRVA
jgi:hypothetical protein